MSSIENRHAQRIFSIVTLGLFALLVWKLSVWYGMTAYAALLFGSWGALWMRRRNTRG
jgi:hypothetical protein